MSSSNTSNTSLTWVLAVNNRHGVYVLLLRRYAFWKTLFTSRVLEFCLCKINSNEVIDWQLPFFLMTFSLLCFHPRLTGTARQPR